MKKQHSFVKYVDIPIPQLGNNIADVERLQAVLKKKLETDDIYFPTELALDFPLKLRQWHHRAKVVLFKDSRGWLIVDILEPDMDTQDKKRQIFGIAADLGTTRIVLRLINLETCEACGELAFDNPQACIAPDVLARIHHAGTREGREELQRLVINGMNEHINLLCRKQRTALGEGIVSGQGAVSEQGIALGQEAVSEQGITLGEGIATEQVALLIVAGNSAMTHLFLGIDSSFLIREPYIPAVNVPEPIGASKLGLWISPRGMVYLFPNIGSYFGGDLISGILFAEIHKKEKPCIMVDVGTNAEVVVGNQEWLIACAGAAGPALEGGVSDIGMTAKPGVIDRVAIDSETGQIDIHTIDEQPAIGICGSGMIDLAAQLFLSGMLDIRGKFSPDRCGGRYFENQGTGCFRLIDQEFSGTGKDIVLTQIDMNSLTSSKAAMYSILQVIVEQTAGLAFSDLAKFHVAGTFGSFINPESAISIGMLPDIPLDRFEVLGNSSLEGASKLLMNPCCFEEIETIRKGITYIELNVNQEFMNIFSGAKFYPHTDISRFPSSG